jgi:hypothetical protein
LAEGSFFFIVPDVLISWAALAGAKSGLRTLFSVTVGSIVAGALLYSWAAMAPMESRTAVAHVPFVAPRMFETVAHDYADVGVIAMLRGPSSGVPYKVYAVLAPPVTDLGTFAIVSVLARLERLGLTWLIFASLGWLFRKPIEDHAGLTAVALAVIWSAVYAFYWTRL